jgi:putative endonuclease
MRTLDAVSQLPLGWCCYLILCADRSYYCRITTNLLSRIKHHSSGKGSGYTKGTPPMALVWYETHPDRSSAAARERQIKAWGRAKKTDLAEGRVELGIRARCVWVSLG